MHHSGIGSTPNVIQVLRKKTKSGGRIG
jgi:hypothetical protein